MRSLLLALLLLVAAPALAEAAVTPGTYGGGGMTAKTRPGFLGTGASWLWAQVAPDGTARLGGEVAVRCGLATVRARRSPAPSASTAPSATAAPAAWSTAATPGR